MLTGKHDFAAFGTPPRSGSSTVRTVFQAEWQPGPEGWIFEVTADAFLYHMVRRMVYLQAAVAQGKLNQQVVLDDLKPQDRPPGAAPVYVQGLAPPNGLFLVEVCYPPGKILG
jgi:tRNA pseudouridine38-40 synthase